MKESTSKEKVLKKIRNALLDLKVNPFPDVDFEHPIYQPIQDTLDVVFAQELTSVGGQFLYCGSYDEMLQNLDNLIQAKKGQPVFCIDDTCKMLLQDIDAEFSDKAEDFHDLQIAVTGCEYLIARLGSVLISSKQGSGRRLNVYPDVHVVIASTSQLVFDIKEGLEGVRKKYGQSMPSLVSLISGPSRTADIEKTLIMGAHGPRELVVIMVDDSNIQ